ncbi:growth/differentiation factor 15-like [Carcharodon carcharias]|uniref:growth/differentiation factor 15-like n=1 Tax=Carcharodon carcharias TaxID=13397 RepID=UPI001B7E2F59|nr:growth/differentiation factor 15-like [Carcharodon carcharias]
MPEIKIVIEFENRGIQLVSDDQDWSWADAPHRPLAGKAAHRLQAERKVATCLHTVVKWVPPSFLGKPPITPATSGLGVDLRPQENHRKWLQIEAVKRGILESLGLEQPPVIRKRASREEEERMLQLFLRGDSKQHNTSRKLSYSLDPVRSVTVFPVEIERARDSGATTQEERGLAERLTLSVSRSKAIFPGLKVLRAELKCYKHLRITEHLERLNSSLGWQVNVYKILETSSQGEEESQLIDSKALHSGPIITFSLNVKPLIELWADSGLQQVRMQLTISPAHPEIFLLTTRIRDSLTLEVETEEVKSIRRERRATSSTEDCLRKQKRCCRKPLLVSFKEIGWSDWIRAPESYNMYICAGSCPANYKAANMHAMIKSAMNQLSGGASPGLCCNPAAYEPMTLLHYSSEGKLTLTAFDDMIVTNCHCS